MNRVWERIERAFERADHAVASGMRWPLLLFLFALVLKVIYVFQTADALHVRVPIMDSRYYDQMAQEIAAGKVARHEAFFMGPLYPYLLGLVYSLVGRDFMVVRLLQMCGGAATVAIVFMIGRRVFRPAAALAGALLLALYGAMTFYEGQLLMEWMGALLNSAALLVLISARDHPSPGRPALAGALLGLSALARASILLFALAVLVWMLVFEKHAQRRMRAAWFAGAVVLTLLPAAIHNYAVSRVFVPVTSNAGVNFYVGNGRQANGTFVPIRDVDLIDDVTTRDYVEGITGREMSPSQVSRFWFERAREDMRADPERALRLFGVKIALFFNGYEVPQIESFDIQKRAEPWLRVLFVRLWLVMPLALLGMVLSARGWRRGGLLHLYVLVYAVSIVAFFVTGRYRAQVAPVLCLFAGYALVAIPARMQQLRPGAATAVALVALFAATTPLIFKVDETLVQFREQVRRARRLSELGSYAPAVREIDTAIALYPRETEGYIHRAIVHRNAGNDFKAIEDYQRALAIDPAQPSVHYDLAQALRRVNLRDEAVREYRIAIDHDPRMLQAHNNLGITFREMKRYDDAIAAWRTLIDIAPGYQKAYNNLGAAYAELGRYEEAVATFAETTSRFPDYANGFKNLGMAHAALKRPRPALEAMRRYVELVPDDLDAREAVRKLEIAVRADTTGAD